ncbi:MAG: hypothetical protein DWP97_02430 [Calditrichaeota bacterium]|nr:MAG: hypothetical protein DWP97_02430 [Calditrichota bacterium]
MHKKILLTLLIIIILAAASSAQEAKPIQVALLNPIQIFNENTEIAGVRINLLYGKNRSVSGLDWGLVNHTTTGVSKGLGWGFINLTEDSFVGWQDGFVNNVKGNFEGFQSGFVNIAHNCSGFQLGIVNYAHNMNGLQIGLVNIIKQNGQFPVFPIVNWSF